MKLPLIFAPHRIKGNFKCITGIFNTLQEYGVQYGTFEYVKGNLDTFRRFQVVAYFRRHKHMKAKNPCQNQIGGNFKYITGIAMDGYEFKRGGILGTSKECPYPLELIIMMKGHFEYITGLFIKKVGHLRSKRAFQVHYGNFAREIIASCGILCTLQEQSN